MLALLAKYDGAEAAAYEAAAQKSDDATFLKTTECALFGFECCALNAAVLCEGLLERCVLLLASRRPAHLASPLPPLHPVSLPACSTAVAAALGIKAAAPSFAIGRNFDDFGLEAVASEGHKAFEGARALV